MRQKMWNYFYPERRRPVPATKALAYHIPCSGRSRHSLADIKVLRNSYN
ncbi:hypothetical protein [Azospirillum melinis]